MYVITAKPTEQHEKGENRILMMGEEMDYMDNGYPRLVKENVAFPSFMVNVNGEPVPDGETSDKPVPAPIAVPEGVEPEKWCYTKAEGFYLNPDYEEPENAEPVEAGEE